MNLQRISSARALRASRSTRVYDPLKVAKTPQRAWSRVIIRAPDEISFFGERYLEFWGFITDLKDVAANGIVLIDLSGVRAVKAAAMLVLYAVIEQLQKELRNIRLVKTTKCSNSIISRMFESMGFWELTREAGCRTKYARGRGIPICTASQQNKEVGSEQAQLRTALLYVKSIFDELGYNEQGALAFAAITESISNVWQHAYAADFFPVEIDSDLKNWWILVDRIQDQLYIVVYDMGAGIPTTFAAAPRYSEMLADAYSILRNAAARIFGAAETNPEGEKAAASIKAAVDYGRSRFNETGRGKGLTEAKEFVKNNPMGTLIIYSGLGEYTFKTKNAYEKADPLSVPFEGTLLQWNIKLDNSGLNS
jgi:anti-sigma regulatory factor (Ser/Thr protein kinase)